MQPLWTRHVYMDNNATTPIAPQVHRAMRDSLKQTFGNPSSLHITGRKARGAVEQARTKVAELLGCEPDRVFFTSGGTEANNTVIKGVFEAAGGGHIVTSKIEHDSTLGACRQVEQRGGKVTYVSAQSDGRVKPEDVRDAIRQFNRPERRAIVFSAGSFVEIAWCMRGFERFLMDMIERPEMVKALLGRVTGLCKEITMRALEAAEGEIDIIWSAGDVGMQTGMIFSRGLWREQIKPFHRELIEPFKEMGLKTRYHTDGGVLPIIDDLIELGLDLLDPIQPNTPGMDPENLSRLFGGRISFYGGVDTQKLLPYGSAREVEEQVLHLIRVLGASGGYVVAACNAVQPDVPIENILALYGTARDYRY